MRTIVLLLAAFALASAQPSGRQHAAPVSPTLALERMPEAMPYRTANIGRPVIVRPLWTFIVGLEDTMFLGDSDFNDAVYRVDCGPAMEDGLVHAKITFVGGWTGYHDELITPTELDIVPGTELVLCMYVENTDMFYFSGAGWRNADHLPHAWVIGAGPKTGRGPELTMGSETYVVLGVDASYKARNK